MKKLSPIFALLAAVAWATLLYVSATAVQRMGFNAAGSTFTSDFAHPWRAQFNTDLSIHLVLVGAWLIWRSRSWMLGLALAFLAINLGALFTLPFLLLEIIKRGGLGAALLGSRAGEVSAQS